MALQQKIYRVEVEVKIYPSSNVTRNVPRKEPDIPKVLEQETVSLGTLGGKKKPCLHYHYWSLSLHSYIYINYYAFIILTKLLMINIHLSSLVFLRYH
jgi:hypothetical protein